MTIWLHTPDLAGLEALCARLAGMGVAVSCEPDAARLRERLRTETPLVALFFTACEEHASLALELQLGAPWARVVFVGESSAGLPGDCTLLPVPNDLVELAPELARELHLAQIQRGWHELASERRRLACGLENAERLATIGRIATGMAHEVNNPLAVIRASAAYVAEIATRRGDSELGLCASDIEAAVERIGAFVQHLTGFARRERPELTSTSLHTALEIALRMIKPHAKEQNVVLAIGACPRHPVPHDPPRLAQAILSLLSNAVEAATTGGGHVAVRVVFGDTEVRIEIDDDGPGVAPELGERVFEPFTTTKALSHATGLGLTITRQIAADHGGHVELEQAEAGGLRASLSLPRFRAAVYRLLVAHGDDTTRRALASELRREGFDVVTAGTFSAAHECLRERPVHIAIVDSGLSELGDALVAQKLALPSAATRIIALCSGSDLSRGEGADHALAGPCDRSELVRVARALCLKGGRRASLGPPSLR